MTDYRLSQEYIAELYEALVSEFGATNFNIKNEVLTITLSADRYTYRVSTDSREPELISAGYSRDITLSEATMNVFAGIRRRAELVHAIATEWMHNR